MNAYILLRNNQEYGPYSTKELQGLGLQTTDLIWEEDESTCWQLATDIPALKNFVKEDKTTSSNPYDAKPWKPFIHAATNMIPPALSTVSLRQTDTVVIDPDIEINFHTTSSKRWRAGRASSIGTGFFAFIMLSIGIVLCAFMIKTMIQGLHLEAPASTARELKQETVAVSTASYTAKATQAVYDTAIKNKRALLKDSAINSAITPKNNLSATIKKAPATTLLKVHKEDKVASKDSTSPAPVSNEKIQTEKELPVKKPAAKMPALQIAANDYKVGFLGGISNLELTISNPSPERVDKATVVVEFLKPNGTVVKSQTILVENIGGNGTKTIAVPSNSRGVKVRYHIAIKDASETLAGDQ